MYLALGGFRISFLTDNIQGAMVVGLIILAVITVGVETKIDRDLVYSSGLLDASLLGWQLIYILPVAVLTNDFFVSGFWMRTFASKTDHDLKIGVIIATVVVTIILLLVGVTGLLAAWTGAWPGNPPQSGSIAFFLLLEQLPSWVVGIVLIMTVSLSAAAFDSFQSAMVSTASNDFFRNRLNIWWIRLAVVAIIAPVIVVALQSPSILQVYLISDLVSAAAIPVLVIGLSDKCPWWSGFEFVVGSLGGLSTVFIFGTIYYGNAQEGAYLLLLENGLYNDDWSAFGEWSVNCCQNCLTTSRRFRCCSSWRSPLGLWCACSAPRLLVGHCAPEGRAVQHSQVQQLECSLHRGELGALAGARHPRAGRHSQTRGLLRVPWRSVGCSAESTEDVGAVHTNFTVQACPMSPHNIVVQSVLCSLYLKYHTVASLATCPVQLCGSHKLLPLALLLLRSAPHLPPRLVVAHAEELLQDKVLDHVLGLRRLLVERHAALAEPLQALATGDAHHGLAQHHRPVDRQAGDRDGGGLVRDNPGARGVLVQRPAHDVAGAARVQAAEEAVAQPGRAHLGEGGHVAAAAGQQSAPRPQTGAWSRGRGRANILGERGVHVAVQRLGDGGDLARAQLGPRPQARRPLDEQHAAHVAQPRPRAVPLEAQARARPAQQARPVGTRGHDEGLWRSGQPAVSQRHGGQPRGARRATTHPAAARSRPCPP